MDKIIKVIIYAAKSTDDTRGSIPSQIDNVRQAVARIGGREEVAVYEDNAASAFKSSREDGLRGPGLAGAFAHAAALASEGVEVELWAYHPDRLARGDGDTAAHLAELYFRAKRQQFRLRAVNEDMTLENPLMSAMMGERNHADSAAKKAHVRAAKQRQRNEGRRLGGPIPWGFAEGEVVRVGKSSRVTLVPHPDRSPVVLEMIRRSLAGDGDRAIAVWANREGHRTTQGKPWSVRTVQNLLRNPVLAGLHRYDIGTPSEQVVEATDVTPIVDRAMWERMMRARNERDRAKVGRTKGLAASGGTAPLFLLQRLAVCSRCGAAMYSQKGSYRRKTDGLHARHYLCANVHGQTGLCDAPKVDAEIIDVAFAPHVASIFENLDEWVRQVEHEATGQIAAVSAQLAQAEAELPIMAKRQRRAQVEYESALDGDDDAMCKAALDALASIERKRRAVEQRMEELRSTLDAAVPADGGDDSLLNRWWHEFAGALRGWLNGSRTVADVNRVLRDRVLCRVELDTLPNGHYLIRPVQKLSGEVMKSIRVAGRTVPLLMPDGSLRRIRPAMRLPGQGHDGADVYLWPYRADDPETTAVQEAQQAAGIAPEPESTVFAVAP